jgi:predicted dehydrogenase
MVAGLSRRRFLETAAVVAAAAEASAADPAARLAARPAPIRIGQIGVKHGHATKLGVYRRSPDYEVIGVVESDAEARRKVEAEPAYTGLPWMTREQLLAVPGLQAVLVETAVPDLLDHAEASIAAGMHVHLDKPAGTSLPQYRRILDAAAERKLVVQMGYMYRYNPAIVMLRQAVAEGWLGEIFEIHAVMGKVLDQASRRALIRYPGGMMLELGCHLIDLAVGVLGKPDRVEGFSRHSSPQSDGLADNMLAVLEYPRATATIRTAGVDVDGFARRQFTVCGTEGTIHIQPLDNPVVRLTLAQPRGGHAAGVQDVTLPKYTRYVDDAADMAAAIRGEKPFAFSHAHDLAVQTAVLDACGLPIDR